MSLLQALIAGFFGDPIASGYSYWGARFWGGPSPYFVSLYLGGAVLCFVAIGAARAERHRTRLLLLLAAGLVVCLGRWARLDVLLELAPVLGQVPVSGEGVLHRRRGVFPAGERRRGAGCSRRGGRGGRSSSDRRSSAWGCCRSRSWRRGSRGASRGCRASSSWTPTRRPCARRPCAASPPTRPRGPRPSSPWPGSRRSACVGGSRRERRSSPPSRSSPPICCGPARGSTPRPTPPSMPSRPR